MLSGSASAAEPVTRFRLDNGLEVVLQEDHSRPLVAVTTSVRAGQRHDPPGYEGLAHYVEHLGANAGEFPDPMALYREMSAVDMNAGTSADATYFYAVVPSAELQRAIWIEARRFALGLDLVSEESARVEREVVLRELIYRGEKTPAQTWRQALQAALYPANHPYGGLFSSRESLSRLSLEGARWFFQTHYTMNRARLVLVGDFSSARARQWVAKYWSALPGPAASAQQDTGCSWLKEEAEPPYRRVVVRSSERKHGVRFLWPVPADRHIEEGLAALRLLREEVTESAASRGLAHSVRPITAVMELGSVWGFEVEAVLHAKLDDVEELVWDVYEWLPDLKWEEKDLRAASRRWQLEGKWIPSSLRERAIRLATPRCGRPVPAEAKQDPFQLEALRAAWPLFDRDRVVIGRQEYDPEAPWHGEVLLWREEQP